MTSAPHSSSWVVNDFGRRAEHSVAVHLNRHLRHDRQVTQFADGPDCLLQFRKVGERFQHEQINAAFEQRRNLRRKHLLRFVE